MVQKAYLEIVTMYRAGNDGSQKTDATGGMSQSFDQQGYYLLLKVGTVLPTTNQAELQFTNLP